MSVKYTDEPMGDPQVIAGFLPSPDQLAFREEGVKVTIALSRESVEFFKSEAATHHTQYQRMIRRLIDAYVECYAGPNSKAALKRTPARRGTSGQADTRGRRVIEGLFQELLELSSSLNDKQQHHVREHMSEEDLLIFDLLTRPAPELSTEERAEVKRVARELLGRLKDLLVLNWRTKGTARAQLKLAIQDTLAAGLPRAYTPELYQQTCSAVFEHVYESYPERDAGGLCRSRLDLRPATPKRSIPILENDS